MMLAYARKAVSLTTALFLGLLAIGVTGTGMLIAWIAAGIDPSFVTKAEIVGLSVLTLMAAGLLASGGIILGTDIFKPKQ